MNFAMHFATPMANLVLVIGRRSAVKSAVGIYDEGETRPAQTQCVRFVLPLTARANTQQTCGED
jgi:hypothetical protein